MADGWWSRQFQNMGLPQAPATPAPQPYQQAPIPGRPSDALRAAQGQFAQHQAAAGNGTYGDILNQNIDGYQPDPTKYGVLKDSTVSFNCPECGSPNFFSRRGAIRSGGKAPAPHCFDCGYNGEAAPFQEPLNLGSGSNVENAGLARGQTARHLDYKTPIAHIK